MVRTEVERVRVTGERGEADGRVDFVVRHRGRWFLAPIPATSSSPPPPVALNDVLAFLARTRLPEAPDGIGEPRNRAPLAGSTEVAPVWAWVGRVCRYGVVVEADDGVLVLLREADLRLLDALDGAVSVGALAAATGVQDAPHRLARLLGAGRVRQLAPGETLWSPEQAKEQALADRPPVAAEDGAAGASGSGPVGADGRIGVHALWQEEVGPALSLGMLTAAARQWDDGALNQRYDIGRPETAGQILASLGRSVHAPAVLLCSNYVWSVEFNLETARAAKALHPDLIVIHGGPSTPKYPADAERFLADHGDAADVLVRGEGEVTLPLLLDALEPAVGPFGLDPDRLAGISGITFRDARTGQVVRTAEPDRIADLDTLPSPYLTGEFDHIDPGAWPFAVSIETNRGCPYGCTFCDWGSATLSRIRKFDIDRVLGEFQWAADRGIAGIQICDANFGIMSRDVDIARGLAEIGRRHPATNCLAFTPPKNTTKHVTKIFDAAIDAGFLVSTAISLQTTDEATLAAVERSNISTDIYLALAAELRRRSLPLTGDLLIGLPGQTYASYKADLQFFIDHQIAPRSWSLRTLPNAPMNAPEYRARHQIETDDDQIVISTASMGPDSRARMLALRKIQVVADQYGVLSHAMHYLQWDHGIAATDLLDHVLDITRQAPTRFPLLAWVFDYFDVHPTAAVGWHAFYGELRALLAEDFGLDPGDAGLDTVLRIQAALMPAPGRTFPAGIDLAHDYAAYYFDATASLFTTGETSVPPAPLLAYPPARFTVTGDPLGLCTFGLRFEGDSRNESMLGQFWLGVGSSHELLSSLTRVSPAFRSLAIGTHDDDHHVPAAVAVALRAGG